MIWLLPHHLPPSVSKLDRRHTRKAEKERQLAEREEGVGKEPNQPDSEKAWSSINHPILSGTVHTHSCIAFSSFSQLQHTQRHRLNIGVLSPERGEQDGHLAVEGPEPIVIKKFTPKQGA